MLVTSPSPRSSRRSNRWAALLALMLSSALAVLLGAVVLQVRRQQAELTQLQGELRSFRDQGLAGEGGSERTTLDSQLRRLSRRVSNLERSEGGRRASSNWELSRLEDRLQVLEDRLSRPSRLPPAPPPAVAGEGEADRPNEREEFQDDSWNDSVW